jgi:hypothetical protein
MTPDLLLESLDRHFKAGCPALSTSQLREHEVTGSCPECRTAGAALLAAIEAGGAA